MLYHGTFKGITVYSSTNYYEEWPGIAVDKEYLFIIDNSNDKFNSLIIKVQTWYNKKINSYKSPTENTLFRYDRLNEIIIVAVPRLTIEDEKLLYIFLRLNTESIMPINFKPVNRHVSIQSHSPYKKNYNWSLQEFDDNTLYLTGESLAATIQSSNDQLKAYLVHKMENYCTITIQKISTATFNLICKRHLTEPSRVLVSANLPQHSSGKRIYASNRAGAISGMLQLMKMIHPKISIDFVVFGSHLEGSTYFFENPATKYTHHIHLSSIFSINFEWQFHSFQLEYFNRFTSSMATSTPSFIDNGYLQLQVSKSVIRNNLDTILHMIVQLSQPKSNNRSLNK